MKIELGKLQKGHLHMVVAGAVDLHKRAHAIRQEAEAEARRFEERAQKLEASADAAESEAHKTVAEDAAKHAGIDLATHDYTFEPDKSGLPLVIVFAPKVPPKGVSS